MSTHAPQGPSRRCFLGSSLIGVAATLTGNAAFAARPRGVPKLFVNQSGYGSRWPKRFTAVGAPDGTAFQLVSKTGTLFEGKVRGGVGDFAAFTGQGQDLLVRLSGRGGGSLAVSDPFTVAGDLPIDVGLEPALRFFVDVRSLVGTHPSAYGGRCFRDQTYYTFELPSLVMLWLAHPDYYRSLPVEIDYERDKRRLLDPDFRWIRDRGDAGALENGRRYYSELEPPRGEPVPDIVQLIHWATGYQLIDPASQDPSGGPGSDPRGERVHGQTVEEFAWFLYAYPSLREWIAAKFADRVATFTFGAWEGAGLFDVITEVGDFKGRHAPGHSVLPNLLMIEVARADGRDDRRFGDAARAQAAWVIANIDPLNPLVTKGQRMSEHKTLVGLSALQRNFPQWAPPGLDRYLARCGRAIIRRSANRWDFRRYSDTEWTIPRYSRTNLPPEDPAKRAQPHGWNDLGSVVGLPAVATEAARNAASPAEAERLREIATAQLDAVFGRNPLGAHAARRGPVDYPGVKRGWPVGYPDDICARLELVRGSLSSSAANDHYLYDPNGDFRHPEGWTGFNAAFNVSLASLIRDRASLTLFDATGRSAIARTPRDGSVRIALEIARGFGATALEQVTLQVEGGRAAQTLIARWDGTRFVTTPLRLDRLGGGAGGLTINYGHGFLGQTLKLRRTAAGFEMPT